MLETLISVAIATGFRFYVDGSVRCPVSYWGVDPLTGEQVWVEDAVLHDPYMPYSNLEMAINYRNRIASELRREGCTGTLEIYHFETGAYVQNSQVEL